MQDRIPRGRSVRLIDVADAAGVSIATASRSLTHSPGVSEQVAQHVRETAARLGYVVNQHARTLAGGQSPIVGLLVHEIGDPYFAEIASGVIDAADRRGMTVQICHTGRDPATELAQLHTLIANRVGTIIVAGSGYVDHSSQAAARRELDMFRRNGGRAAAIGRHHLGVDSVRPDNVAGGESIARHLVELGHRRIAIASGSPELTTVADRLQGICRVLDAHGIEPRDRPIVEVEFTLEGGRAAAGRIIDEHPDVTAVIALNDAMAIGVLSVLRANSLEVPRHLSVAGFGDVAVASSVAPSLTTVRIPITEFGRSALELAISAPSVRPRQRKTSHELVVRDSTAPPRRGP